MYTPKQSRFVVNFAGREAIQPRKSHRRYLSVGQSPIGFVRDWIANGTTAALTSWRRWSGRQKENGRPTKSEVCDGSSHPGSRDHRFRRNDSSPGWQGWLVSSEVKRTNSDSKPRRMRGGVRTRNGTLDPVHRGGCNDHPAPGRKGRLVSREVPGAGRANSCGSPAEGG